MKVFLVNGSPKKDGNTHRALTEVTGALNAEGVDTEIFHIGKKAIAGCMDCRACASTGRCVIKDNVNEFRDLAESADGLVFGTPVYYAAPAGGLVSFMDRLFFSSQHAVNPPFYLKPAAAAIVARRAGTTATFDQMNKYFALVEMPIVPSGYWNMAFGQKPGEVSGDPEGLQTMRTLGRNMAWLLKCLQAGAKAGVAGPHREERILTNFIR